MTTKITKSEFIFLQDSLEKTLISKAKKQFTKQQQQLMTVADACKGVFSYEKNGRELLFTKKASDIANKVQFNLNPADQAKILHIAEIAKKALQQSIDTLKQSDREINLQNQEILKNQRALNAALKSKNTTVKIPEELLVNDSKKKIQALEERFKFYDAISTNSSLYSTNPPAPSRTNSTNNLNQTTNRNGQSSTRKIKNLTTQTEERILPAKKASASSTTSIQNVISNQTPPNNITKIGTNQITQNQEIDETPPRSGKVAQTKRCELTDEQGAFITVATAVAGLAIYIYSNYF